MPYVLDILVLRTTPRIRISKKEYEAFAAAMSLLMHLSNCEEKFATLIDNYFELEKSLLEEALRTMIFSDHDDLALQVPKLTISRRILNLLTATKLYLDSFPQHANVVLADTSSVLETVKKAPSAAYDKSLSYRVMEALRNYAQHEALPVHDWTTGSAWDRSVQPHRHNFSVEPFLDIELLRASSKFKKGVLGELEKRVAKDDRVLQLKPHVRVYVELLSEVQESFRKATKERREAALQLLASGRARYARRYKNDSLVALAAFPVDKRGVKSGKHIYLAPPVVQYVPHLLRLTRGMVNYSMRHVVY